jgi:tRNA-dihydrouridine synthase B
MRPFWRPCQGLPICHSGGLYAALVAVLSVTEMVASAAILRDVRSEMRKLRTDTVAEAPLSVQLAGWDPDIMAEAAKIAADLGATFIDINMGCPAKKVTGRLSGSALMRDEALAASILQAVSGAVDVPVTLKMRLGWDDDSLNAPVIARHAFDAGYCDDCGSWADPLPDV